MLCKPHSTIAPQQGMEYARTPQRELKEANAANQSESSTSLIQKGKIGTTITLNGSRKEHSQPCERTTGPIILKTNEKSSSQDELVWRGCTPEGKAYPVHRVV